MNESEELKEQAKNLFFQGDNDVPATKMTLWQVSQRLNIPKSTLYKWAEKDIPTWDAQKNAFLSKVEELVVREDAYAVAKKEVARVNQIDDLLDIVLPKIKNLFLNADTDEAIIRALKALGKSGALDTLVNNSLALKARMKTQIHDREEELPENWESLPTNELERLVEIK